MIETDLTPVKAYKEVQHLEEPELSTKEPKISGTDEVAHPTHMLLKSRYDGLSIPKTAWVFRKSAMYCTLAFSLCMIDSWEVSRRGPVRADTRSPWLGPSLSTKGLSSNLAVETKRVY